MLIDLLIITLLVVGIRLFREPAGAKIGNYLNIAAMGAAGLAVLVRHPPNHGALVLLALLAGSALGTLVALRVTMIQIPAMVAFQHGAGGVAAFLVSFVELGPASADLRFVGVLSGIVGIIVGAATFSGSMVASGKLANRLPQKPVSLPFHNKLLATAALAAVVLGLLAAAVDAPHRPSLLVLLIISSVAVGLLFSVRIGGADMPVLISFLNATAGLAAALCGIIIQNRLLIACGATVAASGSILTLVMCRAMNRDLRSIFLGTATPAGGMASAIAAPDAATTPSQAAATASNSADGDPFGRATKALKAARRIIVIPGYGMALAQAQFAVVALANRLEAAGATVRFAIHPVAGRMPGHMNVLLAEADVDYEKLAVDLGAINPDFKTTDAVLVVGACDVVNPAAVTQEGTPISGMPILAAHEAAQIIVCNLDAKPGYSGVENELYGMAKSTLLFGDARETVEKLQRLLTEPAPA